MIPVGSMSAFFNLVRLVTGMDEPNPVTSSPGQQFTKWVFVDECSNDETTGEGKVVASSEVESVQSENKASEDQDGVTVVEEEGRRSVDSTSCTTGSFSDDRMNSAMCGANCDDIPSTTKSKSQKKREKKKKSRNRSYSTSSVTSKSVSWGVVEEVLFVREQGLVSVPSSGLFPLGFGVEVDRAEIPVDLHVSTSQVNLIERAQKLGITIDPGEDDNKFRVLETRQFDYRKGKNPLFHSLKEDERCVHVPVCTVYYTIIYILCGLVCLQILSLWSYYILLDSYDITSVLTLFCIFISLQLLGSCVRPRARSRSSSLGSDENVHTINDSNKEIMDIRKSRETSPGCSCKAIKVDKLSVSKMKQELINHQDIIGKSVAEINVLPKADLITSVREMLLSCPLCISNNCECVQEGVGCHAEVCSCFKHNSRQECANKFNEKSYSSTAVDEYRKKFINTLPADIIRKSK